MESETHENPSVTEANMRALSEDAWIHDVRLAFLIPAIVPDSKDEVTLHMRSECRSN